MRIAGGESIGDGASTGAVQYGYQVAKAAKGRFQDIVARRQASGLPGKTAAGVLLFGADRSKQKFSTVTEAQTGVFMVGDKNRAANPHFDTLSTAGAVILGERGKVASGAVAAIGLAGVVLDGNRNVVRGVRMTDMPVGVCIRDGVKNNAKGLSLFNVPVDVVSHRPCATQRWRSRRSLSRPS